MVDRADPVFPVDLAFQVARVDLACSPVVREVSRAAPVVLRPACSPVAVFRAASQEPILPTSSKALSC